MERELRDYATAAILDGLTIRDATGEPVGALAVAVGDVKYSLDGGALTNLASQPAYTPVGSRLLRVQLTAAELTGKRCTIYSQHAGAPQQVVAVVDTYGHASAQIVADFGTRWPDGTVASTSTGTTTTFTTDLERPNYYHWTQRWTGTGLDSAGWTQYAVTVKEDPALDGDDEALLVVRVTSPADAGDGLRVLNRKAVAAADYGKATLAVTAAGGNTTLDLDVQAAAMGVPPTVGSKPWYYEITRWTGTKKERVGYGRLKVPQAVRRGAGVP